MHVWEKEPAPGEAPEGVSVWDHVKNGAQTGFEVGAPMMPFMIPSIIGGAAMGLGTGLWDLHQEHEDRDLWKRTMGPELRALDDTTAGDAKKAPTAEAQRAVWDKHDKAEERWFQADRYTSKRAGGEHESLFDKLF
jgi:hypothetical protein